MISPRVQLFTVPCRAPSVSSVPRLSGQAGADLFFAEIGHMSELIVLTTDKEANGAEKPKPK